MLKRAVIWALALGVLLAALAGAAAEAFDAAPTLPPAQPLRTVRLRAAGDLMVHRRQLELARQPDGSYDFHPQYAMIAGALANADYTIANLETTIGKYGNMDYSGFPLFNTPEALLEAVRDAGVDFLTLANNHMLDRYFEGMVATVDNVEHFGFDHGGANRTEAERDAPVVVDVNGVRIGMLCYTQMTNGMEAYCSSDVKAYGVNYLRKADFAADVQKLRDAGAEVVIAMPHWGEEYRRQPEANTVSLAKIMIAAGVDVILGSHPHMVQPVRFVEAQGPDGRTRRGLVAYSLGNFISNMTVRYTDSGLLLDFTLRERQDGGFEAVDVRFVPIFCWRSKDAIRAVASCNYLEAPPEGMDKNTWARLKESCRELRALIDPQIEMIGE
ncbi:MAG: CapA family protein [Clostridia bacterium]|nr:CapA family protein [Clostridia bacterium]